MKNYYVYAHINPVNGRTFYIGRGCGRRSMSYHGRNSMWKSYVRGIEKSGCTFSVVYLHTKLTLNESIFKEVDEINAHISRGESLLNKNMGEDNKESKMEILGLGCNEDDRKLTRISEFVRQKRKASKLTQPDFASKSGVGIRFLRELEGGKRTLRLDKVNDVLSMFGCELAPVEKLR